jgi:hypothetical protein
MPTSLTKDRRSSADWRWAGIALASLLALAPRTALAQDNAVPVSETGLAETSAVSPGDAASRILDPDSKIASKFVLDIPAPDSTTDVYVQSIYVGQAPTEMVLPCVPFQLSLKSPYIIPVVQEIRPNPGEIIVVNLVIEPSPAARKLGLEGQMSGLILKKRELQDKNKLVLGVNLASWITAGVGLALAGILFMQKDNIVGAYQKAADPAAMATAIQEVNLFNVAVPVGLGVGSAGLISGIISSIMAPDIGGIDRQTKTLREKIDALAKDLQP